jgi:7-keto-8-aminopelargonate synthetase-like enzyme
VIVPHATFKAWVEGTLSVGEHVWQAPPAQVLHHSTSSVPEAALGVRVTLFSTNDYLGLSSHPAVRAAYAAGSARAGSGPRASALVAGYTDAHRALEAQLAVLKRTQECLLFPTGFAANVSVLQARPGRGVYSLSLLPLTS